MKYTKVIIGDSMKDNLVDYLAQKQFFEYVDDKPGITILAGEEYPLLSDSKRSYFIIIRHADNNLEIDIICSSGKISIFQTSAGSEKGLIRATQKLIHNYCEENGFEYSEVE
ncbi:MAG: hypothetical protein QM802_09815 [Agriterribacter sp.]